jgi:hypothetical protein
VGVVDAGFNRIMIFPPFASWPSTGPPSATTILGQPNTCTQSPNQTCKAPNNGNVQPSGLTFSAPAGVAYTGTDLYLADSGNNRVLDLPQTNNTFGAASRILGQDFPYANSPNLIEGREFQFTGTVSGSSGLFSDAGMAIDNGSGTPHLYVADPYNNRVLGFKDLRKFQNGAKNKADIVLGQADFTTALINFPSGNPNTPNSSGLYRPVGLVVDAKGQSLCGGFAERPRIALSGALFLYRDGAGTGRPGIGTVELHGDDSRPDRQQYGHSLRPGIFSVVQHTVAGVRLAQRTGGIR